LGGRQRLEDLKFEIRLGFLVSLSKPVLHMRSVSKEKGKGKKKKECNLN
jgi:hypothetical protein